MKTSSEQPSEASLLKMLDIQWQDHFQTRRQTWKTLEVAAVLAVALVGLNWRFANPLVTVVAAALLVFVALTGAQITLRHRKVEETKFRIIAALEARLGVADPELRPPRAVPWWWIFLIWRSNTTLFILRMHFVILVFALGYLVLRLLELLHA